MVYNHAWVRNMVMNHHIFRQIKQKYVFVPPQVHIIFQLPQDGGPHKSHDVVIHKLKHIP